MFYNIEPGEKAAIISEDGSLLTYSDLYNDINTLSKSLVARKMALCLCENSPASVVGYLACLNTKVVPLLLDKKIDDTVLNALLGTYSPCYLYVPDTLCEKFSGYEEIDSYRNYKLLKKTEEKAVELYEDLALLLTTSGSTGSPKLVRQSYRNIQSNAEAIVKYLEISEADRPVTTLPMNYTYGLSIINSHLQAKATILMTSQPMNMKPFWDFVKQNGATTFGGVPFTYELLKKVRFFKMDLPSIKYMTQAGGRLDPELHREFATWCEEKGKKFIVMYGQTEATARMSYLPTEKSIEKYGSIGIAIPGGRFTIIDTEDKEIFTPETPGELIYVGENVTLGYAEKPEDLAKEDENGGRLCTGDIAKFDKDGFFYIVGRKKRFLKIYGNRVNLDEVDALIKKEFPGVDCASTGKDDHMCVFITDEQLISNVRMWISSLTHLSENAFEIRYIPEIPRNDSGKVLYVNLPQ